MALPFLARRLHVKHPRFTLPVTVNSILTSASTSNPSSSVPAHHFSQAFHQTVLSLPRRPTLCIHHLSTLHSFASHILDDPIALNDEKFQLGDAQDPAQLHFLELLKKLAHFSSEGEVTTFLNDLGIEADPILLSSAIWTLREDWKAAFFAFKWGEKWNCNDVQVCNLMIWVLGNHTKFSTAWCLIRDMHRSSMCTRRAMLIMIDRYAHANNPAKAIHTFNFMEKFRSSPDQEAFHALLNSLCKHGNIEEAEEFMLVNKKLFPLESESFNIILNGWCNILVDVTEAKRVWREMSNYCITRDATSYSLMISCFSKTGNLYDSLRFYDGMKKSGWVPGIDVYNSLVYVLTRENCLKGALKIIEKLKEEGLEPDSATFNSMIRPLCAARKPEEARIILSTMVEENLSPSVETYHAFLEVTDYQGTLEFLVRMKNAGLGPNGDTFLIILGKFLKLGKPVTALKIWEEMKRYNVVPSCMHYTMMVEGLASCRWFVKATEFYKEMISNGYSEDPTLKKLLREEVLDDGGKGKKNARKAKYAKKPASRKA